MPLVAGDVITSINGTAVFAYADLLYLLNQYATAKPNGGIEAPLTLTVLGRPEPTTVKTTFFFNQRYWGERDGGAFGSFAAGAGNAIALGAGASGEVFVKDAAKFGLNVLGSIWRKVDPKTTWEDMPIRQNSGEVESGVNAGDAGNKSAKQGTKAAASRRGSSSTRAAA